MFTDPQVGTDWVSVSAGMNCSQQVLDMNLLRYLHTSHPGAPAADFFVFHLLDGKNRSPAQHFHITVKKNPCPSYFRIAVFPQSTAKSYSGLAVFRYETNFHNLMNSQKKKKKREKQNISH